MAVVYLRCGGLERSTTDGTAATLLIEERFVLGPGDAIRIFSPPYGNLLAVISSPLLLTCVVTHLTTRLQSIAASGISIEVSQRLLGLTVGTSLIHAASIAENWDKCNESPTFLRDSLRSGE